MPEQVGGLQGSGLPHGPHADGESGIGRPGYRELAMIASRTAIGVPLVVLMVSSWAYGADDPNQAFKELFGAEAAKVAATPSPKDDAEFAQRLLTAAAEVKGAPALQALLYDKAYASGMRGEVGYPAAIQAARLLGELVPARKAECDEKLLKVCELQYRSAKGEQADSAGRALLGQLHSMADAKAAEGKAAEALGLYRRALVVARRLKSSEAPRIARSIEVALAGEQVDKDVARLQAQVAADKTNRTAARSLLMLHLTERDDPNKAAELLPLVVPDQVLESYLPLLVKPWKDLPEQAVWDLANWYVSLAAKAGPAGKPRMLARAKTYVELFLDLHAKDDVASLKAKGMLKEVAAALEAAGGAPPGKQEGQSQDMLLARRLNDLAQWKVVGGKWEQVKEQIIGRGDGALDFQQKLPGNGVLEFTLQVTEGMRPRISFRGFYLGNEGYSKQFGFHGDAKDRSGSYLPYDETTVMRIRLTMDGEKLDLKVNDKPLAKAKRAAVESETLRISCGDGWSKGTTKYWAFKFTSLPDAAAPK
jgi:hypothetical protein